MFAEEDLTCDGFLGGRIHLWQPRDGFRSSIDAVLLAASVPARAGEAVLELGCGAGAATLCLAARVAGLDLVGVELQPDYTLLARRNANAMRQVAAFVEADLRRLPPEIAARTFDHVMANPPYLARNAGTAAGDTGRETALREDTPLADWVAVALRRLRPGGTLTIIQAAERLPDLLAALPPAAGSLTLLPVLPREGRAARRVILRARKGRKGAFTLTAPLILHAGSEHLADGDDFSTRARAILRDGAPLEF